MSSNNILVKLENAGFKIKNKILVEGISLSVEKGKIVTLIGPNAVSYTHLRAHET